MHLEYQLVAKVSIATPLRPSVDANRAVLAPRIALTDADGYEFSDRLEGLFGPWPLAVLNYLASRQVVENRRLARKKVVLGQFQTPLR